MVLRIDLVELLDRSHRIAHQIIILPEQLFEIHLSAAAAVSSRKKEYRLLRLALENDLQDIGIIPMLVESCVDRYFGRFLPCSALRDLTEQQSLCPRLDLILCNEPFILVNVCEHLQAVYVDHTGEHAADHFAVALIADRNDASGSDQRQQDFHIIPCLIAENLRDPGPRRKLCCKNRLPLHSAESVLETADPGENRRADGQCQHIRRGARIYLALKAVSQTAPFIDNVHIVSRLKLRAANLPVLLHVVPVIQLALPASSAVTGAGLGGPHKEIIIHLLHLSFFFTHSV